MESISKHHKQTECFYWVVPDFLLFYCWERESRAGGSTGCGYMMKPESRSGTKDSFLFSGPALLQTSLLLMCILSLFLLGAVLTDVRAWDPGICISFFLESRWENGDGVFVLSIHHGSEPAGNGCLCCYVTNTFPPGSPKPPASTAQTRRTQSRGWLSHACSARWHGASAVGQASPPSVEDFRQHWHSLSCIKGVSVLVGWRGKQLWNIDGKACCWCQQFHNFLFSYFIYHLLQLMMVTASH